MPGVNYNSEPQLHSDQISKETRTTRLFSGALWTHKSVQNQAYKCPGLSKLCRLNRLNLCGNYFIIIETLVLLVALCSKE